MSFGGGGSTQASKPPPVPLIGNLSNEVAVRAYRSRSKKRFGVEDTILTGLGGVGRSLASGIQRAQQTANTVRTTLLGGG